MNDWGIIKATKVDREKIQCTKCKYQAIDTWEGITTKEPCAPSCKKYAPVSRGGPGKPAGTIHPIVDVQKHELYTDGHYKPCPKFKPLPEFKNEWKLQQKAAKSN